MPAGRPGGQGLVERVNAYPESSFLPGRRFISSHDFNVQLVAHTRCEVNDAVRPPSRMVPAEFG